jgi:hypothetical protein
MTIQALYPDISPSLSLDFANVKKLDPRVTFARASTARYYDGKTVAKAEENLYAYSQEINDAYWSKFNLTVTANTTTAPDGTTTAETITASAVPSITPSFLRTIPAPVETYTSSYFVKAGTHNFVQLYNTNGAAVAITFDLSTGTYLVTTGTPTGGIESLADGWYRIWMTYTATNSAGVGTGFLLAETSSATRLATWSPVGTETVFVWGAQLEQRSSVTAYTATTTQPITNYIPVLLSAADNEARFDHNPTTSESLGLLIEEQRTNLVVRSEEFDNAAWTNVATTVTQNNTTAPDGVISAELIIADTTNANHSIRSVVTTPTNSTYTFSVYAKQATGVYGLGIAFGSNTTTGVWNSANRGQARFDLTNGTVVTFSGTGNATGINASIVPVGNGWYRCSFTFIPDTTGASTVVAPGVVALPTSQSAALAWVGNGTSGAFVWGAQLEAGAFPTSYIPTVASQVTRSADAASMTGANFSSWYRQDEGTTYTDFNAFGISGNTFVSTIAGASLANDHIANFLVSANLRVRIQLGGAGIWSANLSINPLGSYKTSIAYKIGDGAATANGNPVVTNAITSLPIVNRLVIASSTYSGYVKKIAFYPKRLTNEQLQALTT